jgi:hypothetical protein
VDIYPDDPTPLIELAEFIEVVARIPASEDVRDRVDMYPDDPRPWIEDT